MTEDRTIAFLMGCTNLRQQVAPRRVAATRSHLLPNKCVAIIHPAPAQRRHAVTAYRAMTTTTISVAEVPAIQARLRGWIQALRECETEITRLKAAGVPTGGILADLEPLALGLALGLQLLDQELGENPEWIGPREQARAWSSSRPQFPAH